MALTIAGKITTNLVNNPKDLQRVYITHDGEIVSYLHNDNRWFTFSAYKSLMAYSPATCIEVTAETVIAEIIHAIALSVKEPVELWLS